MKLSGRREPGSGSEVFAGVAAPIRNDDATRNDPTSVAFELVGTPTIFGFLGYLADRWLGTSPVIMFVAAGLSFITVLGLVIWRYNNDMDHATAEHRAARASRGPGRARWERPSSPDVDAEHNDADHADSTEVSA